MKRPSGNTPCRPDPELGGSQRNRELDVRSFGACGDGRGDDTAAFQKALDYAGEVQGTVRVPEGVYLCAGLKMHPGTGLSGYPAWSYRAGQGSVLRLADDSARCLLDLTGAFGAAVQGLCLHGGEPEKAAPGAGLTTAATSLCPDGGEPQEGQFSHGILIDKAEHGKQEDAPRIDTCRVEGFSGDGIHLKRVWCFSIRHSHCIFNRGCGVRVHGCDGFLLDNWLSLNGMAGFGAYEPNASFTMTGNRIEWNRQGGIVVRGGTHYNITGNYIDRSGRCGISLLPGEGERVCHTMAITGNIIYRSGKPDWGIEDPHDSSHVRFEGCRGLAFSGNILNAGRDDDNSGELSPDYAMVLRALETSVITSNAMYQGSLKELILDLGGHASDVIVKDNVGSLRDGGTQSRP